MTFNQDNLVLNYYQQPFSEAKLQIINSGQELMDLSMINPDLEPDREILDKLVEFSLKSHSSRYAVSRGIRPLREAICRKYSKAFGVQLSAEQEVCVVQGAKDGLLSAFSSLLKPGDRVLLPKPCYPGHLAAAELAHLKCDFYSVSEDSELMLSQLLQKVKDYSPQMLILNFPNNPTGISVPDGFYRKLVEQIDPQTIIINDFVYGEMNFDNLPASSLLSVGESKRNLLEIFSLSKSHSLAGWRVGAIAGDANLIKVISRYKSHVDYGLFLPIQFATAAALTSTKNFVAANTEIYSQRAALLQKELVRGGFKVSKSTGGCSLWVKLPDTVRGYALDFCLTFLIKEKIAISPGEFFELHPSRHFRIALVAGDLKLIQMAEKIRSFASRCSYDSPSVENQ